jgi:1,4-dihydroxy-6-naphthoate synthase
MRSRTLTIAYTPDSDDAFYYDAIEQGIVSRPGLRFRFVREPMARLNRAARTGRYDVTAISSVVYPLVADRYAILAAGTSVGRGYGPVLVARDPIKVTDLAGLRVGVPGVPTTGWFLLRHLFPGTRTVELPYDRIAAAVAGKELDAGVMIHEELLFYPKYGLRKVADLGAEWCRRYGLPLPVGLNVIRRNIEPGLAARVCDLIVESLRFGRAHSSETLDRVCRFGRGSSGGVTEEFVRMFANDDSEVMPSDVRQALPVLFRQVVRMGLAPDVPRVDVVEPVVERMAVA